MYGTMLVCYIGRHGNSCCFSFEGLRGIKNEWSFITVAKKAWQKVLLTVLRSQNLILEPASLFALISAPLRLRPYTTTPILL